MMRYTILFALFILGLSEAKAQAELHWKFDTVQATSLSNNVLEDEISRVIEVYLPPSYYHSNRRYPVVYYLSGYNSRGRAQNYKVKEHKGLLDEKIEQGLLDELIFVMISGTNRLRGSFYVNSPVTGNWADFITNDVVKFVDHNYRTIAFRDSRCVTGSSMGGYGALNLAMLYPGVYCAGYGISPGLYKKNGFDDSQIVMYKNNIANTLNMIDLFDGLSKKEAHAGFMNFLDTCTDRTLFFTMAYGAAHAPDTDKAPYFTFPYKVVGKDTIVDQEIWQLWQNGFGGIDQEIEAYKNNLEQLKVYGIACGYNEGYRWIYEGCQYYSAKLAENKISHELYLHQGTHTSLTLDVLVNQALPILTNAMDK